MKLPQIFRIFSRTFVVFAILSLFAFTLLEDTANIKDNKNNNRPDDFRVRLDRADLYLSRGDVKKAEGEINSILVFWPGNVFALEKLSKIKDKKETYLEISKVEDTIKKRPDYKAAWIKLADLYENVGRVDLAREARSRAYKLTTI